MSYITVKKADNLKDLEELKRRLEAIGVNCRIKKEKPNQVTNAVPSPLAELQVAESDMRKAKDILS
ncbi:hypothetical protein SAMN05444280_1335 [Tangfeifania diversioriginum]|jgi:hypothetical protein|uniref:Uncharacterized protein n=1 Tax=Tangfeifania diversioriginum TaxID=1168035 RepID=A0A1M6MHN6_9BACT|nr:hypothetical protein [Tangfeifania diversioriginum]SHJ82820.1 hypothetical protein SAMN05444280_1335 [Tangfeifania diversioriginum]